MKSKPTESFEKKMLSYSLLAGTFLLGGSAAAQSDIWDSGEINQVLTSPQSFKLIFNSGDTCRLSISNYGQSGVICRSSLFAEWAVDASHLPFARRFYSGNVVQSTGTWYNKSNNYPLFTAAQTFGGGNPIYIGVLIGASKKPGWIKLTVPDPLPMRSFFTVNSWAYERGTPTSITINGALPVELTSFTALMQGTMALLEWNTATEVNNHGFDMERNVFPENSGSEPSVSEWEKIGFTAGNGNSNSPKSYRFVDTNPPAGLVMYRLKQIDTDGTTSYSPLVTVQNTAPEGFELLQNYPNPFNPSTVIKYAVPQEGYVSIKVYDMLGSEIATLVNETQKAGKHSVTFNAENIPSGTYMYRLQSGDYTETKKLMIIK